MTEQSSYFRWLTGIAGGSDLMVYLSLQSTSSTVQSVAGRLRKQGDIPSSILLA